MDAIEAYKMIHIIKTVEDSQNLLFILTVKKKRENWTKLQHAYLDPQKQSQMQHEVSPGNSQGIIERK